MGARPLCGRPLSGAVPSGFLPPSLPGRVSGLAPVCVCVGGRGLGRMRSRPPPPTVSALPLHRMHTATYGTCDLSLASFLLAAHDCHMW